MDIIIKGIDLDTDYGLCILTIGGELITANGKHFQAIQIPTPHGRLIDESEAVKGWCEGCAFKDTEECADCKDKEMCKYAPTLLEREETK